MLVLIQLVIMPKALLVENYKTSEPLTDIAPIIQRIAEEAGALALSYFERMATVPVESKGHLDLVTQADKDVEGLINRRLEDAFPDDGVFGEEGAVHTGSSGRLWVIDAIDGTFNLPVLGDALHHLSGRRIAEKQVHNRVSELGLLDDAEVVAQQTLGVGTIQFVADRGTFKTENIEACEAAELCPAFPNRSAYSPLPRGSSEMTGSAILALKSGERFLLFSLPDHLFRPAIHPENRSGSQ
jgi:hypothetical protein